MWATEEIGVCCAAPGRPRDRAISIDWLAATDALMVPVDAGSFSGSQYADST
jgi:hypothetical protein